MLLPVCAALIFIIDRFAGRKRKSLKRKLARAVRYALCFLLTAALAGPMLFLPGNRAATWVLCDLSASTSGNRGQLEQSIQEGLEAAPDDLMIGAIAFGRDAMVDIPLAAGRKDISLSTAPDASQTDIGHGLSMALALLPDDIAGRVALISDGKDNGQGVQSQILAYKAKGIAVDVLPLADRPANDAQVSAVTPPTQVYQREKFDVIVRVDSNYDTQGTLVLFANWLPAGTRDVTIRKGENAFIFQDIAKESGVITYEAQLIADGDTNSHNNRLGAYMDVRGVPRILIVGADAELAPLLKAAGMETDTILPGQMPVSAEAIRQYHAVALVNVNADDLSDEAIAALDDYVRKLGRGLVAFGGDDTYALGGWRGSPLEDLMPVTMDVDNRMDMPSLSLVLIIDKSGSMTEGRFGITKLDMAKEAAMRSAEALVARDTVGVIAFDDTAKWAVPMQGVADVASIQDMIGTIRPGGGTAFYSALSQALDAQMEAQAQLKHVIFLTDGEASDGGHEALVQQMAENGITFTTVAVGRDANAKLLAKLAALGGGRTYVTTEFDDIPKVFTKETYLATQSYAQNRTFFPAIWSDSALTRYDGFPSLDGYLATTGKPLTTIEMATDREDPLLAWWQYGAGRVMAWTSDLQGAWTHDFLLWNQSASFFAGIIAHILPAEAGEGELSLTRQGSTVKLRYTVEGEDTGLSTEAMVLAPDGTTERAVLSITAPGVFEGAISAAQEGAYAVRIEQKQGDELFRTLETGLTVGYSEEYDLRAADGKALLEKIARETGGRLLTENTSLFAERGTRMREKQDITPMLMWIAIILFVLDVAQRRLAWERLIPEKKAKNEEKGGTRKKNEASLKPKETKALRDEPTDKKRDHALPGETAEKLLEGRKKKLM